MKRILYVSDALSIHTRRWAEHYRDQGVDVHIASFRKASIPGVSIHQLPTGGLGKLGYLLAIPFLRRLASQLRPDVIHAQYVTSYGFLAAMAGLRPLVLTAWGTDVLISPKESKLMCWLARYAVRHADAVTTVAQHMNPAVARLGVPLEEVSAVPFGVDSQRFVPLPDRPQREVLRLISTRNFAPIYSVDTVIAAVATCARRGLRLSVHLVGAGELREALERQVVEAGLSDCVEFHGHVDHARLAALLADADIFVSSALSDGNNVSLNEAMACACFPIATNIPANAQWIEDGKNGLLYPSGDADALADCIVRAAEDKDQREHAGRLNRQIVEQRADWRVCVDRMNITYAQAITNARAGV
ncbi:glycosyltransferase [Comamonas guangdongensis]|uniref:Glycosyltransferase n=1 Tax=Comamonas guangdongensis TaxID=510515 RepID=A0ABV3ZSY9_9BURK